MGLRVVLDLCIQIVQDFRLHLFDLRTGHELKELHGFAAGLGCHFLRKRGGSLHRCQSGDLALLDVDHVLDRHAVHAGQVHSVVLGALEAVRFCELNDIAHLDVPFSKKNQPPHGGAAEFPTYQIRAFTSARMSSPST